MDRTKDIIDKISQIAGRFSAYEIFADWVRCMAISISNVSDLFHNAVWKNREAEYLKTMQKYESEEQEAFGEMTAFLVETLCCGLRDVMGDIYMSLDQGSKQAGQFFTPYHVSQLTAQIAAENAVDGKCQVHEPSCGSGGMIIAVADTLRQQGYNYQKIMRVVAQDLDWRCVYMCYVQLSLLGIKATVVQGDTLCNPYTQGYPPERVLHTPARKGMLL